MSYGGNCRPGALPLYWVEGSSMEQVEYIAFWDPLIWFSWFEWGSKNLWASFPGDSDVDSLLITSGRHCCFAHSNGKYQRVTSERRIYRVWRGNWGRKLHVGWSVSNSLWWFTWETPNAWTIAAGVGHAENLAEKALWGWMDKNEWRNRSCGRGR